MEVTGLGPSQRPDAKVGIPEVGSQWTHPYHGRCVVKESGGMTGAQTVTWECAYNGLTREQPLSVFLADFKPKGGDPYFSRKDDTPLTDVRVTIELKGPDYDLLVKKAEEECRTPQEQATWLVLRGLRMPPMFQGQPYTITSGQAPSDT